MHDTRPGCPSVDQIALFCEGAASPQEMGAMQGHLDTCEGCRALVAESARTPIRFDDTLPQQAPPVGIVRGTLLGRYVVLGLVAKGGMGAVYSAYDPELKRQVALKVLHVDGSSSEQRTLLLHEAQVLARFSHPNVATIHDAGTWGDRVFLALELVDGGTLRDWLAERPRSWREAVDILVAAGQGLAAAHRAGLVHRDFKPENVLIGSDGRVRVTDFGLAGPSGTGSISGAFALTAPEPLAGAGTPAYMAPEQVTGAGPDARADLFSFCVVLYEALYGVRPFAGDSVATIRRAIVSGRLNEPLRDRRVPAWLRKQVVAGLAADPEARPASMDVLLQALRADPSRPRNRALVVAALVTAAVGVGVIVQRTLSARANSCTAAGQKIDATWSAARHDAIARAFATTGVPYAGAVAASTTTALDQYASRWKAMRTDACEATRVRKDQSEELFDLRVSCLDRRLSTMSALVALLLGADRSLVEGASTAVEQLPDLDACADVAALRLRVSLPSDPRARARIAAAQTQLASADALNQAGKYAEAKRALTVLLPLVDAIGYPPLRGDALLALAAAQEGLGDWKVAEKTLIDAALAADAGRDDVARVFAWTQLILIVGYRESRDAEGLTWARYARAVLARMGGNPRAEARILTGEGTVYAEAGQLDLALPAHQRAVALEEKLFGADSAEVATTLLHLGYDYFALGQFDRALAAYQRSLTIRQKVLGADHPRVAMSLVNIGNAYYQKRELATAASYYQRALAVQEASLGPDNFALYEPLNNLGNVYSDQKDWPRALAAYQRGLSIVERKLGPDDPNVSDVVGNIGDVYVIQGHPEQAIALYERSLRILTKAHGADHASLAHTLNNLGEAYLLGGNLAKAALVLERALVLRTAHPSNPADLASIQFDLAKAIVARDPRRARALATAAHDTYARAGEQYASEVAAIASWLTSK